MSVSEQFRRHSGWRTMVLARRWLAERPGTVGGGAIILPGVRIGSRAVIGAGSVITRDIPDAVFAAGSPCRVIRPIGE